MTTNLSNKAREAASADATKGTAGAPLPNQAITEAQPSLFSRIFRPKVWTYASIATVVILGTLIAADFAFLGGATTLSATAAIAASASLPALVSANNAIASAFSTFGAAIANHAIISGFVGGCLAVAALATAVVIANSDKGEEATQKAGVVTPKAPEKLPSVVKERIPAKEQIIEQVTDQSQNKAFKPIENVSNSVPNISKQINHEAKVSSVTEKPENITNKKDDINKPVSKQTNSIEAILEGKNQGGTKAGIKV